MTKSRALPYDYTTESAKGHADKKSTALHVYSLPKIEWSSLQTTHRLFDSDGLTEECTTTSEGELQHIQNWTQGCNLSLNRTKTREIIFQAKGRRDNSTQLPAVCPGIDRVKQLTMVSSLPVCQNNSSRPCQQAA